MNISVSDHAVLRYLERRLGFDVATVRRDLETQLARAAATAEQIGAGHYAIRHDGLRFFVRNGTVVTVVPGESTSRIQTHAPARASQQQEPLL